MFFLRGSVLRKIFLPIMCAFLAIATSVPAFASTDSLTLTAHYQGWKVYRYHAKNGPVCFMSAPPQKEQGHYTSRGQVFFFVTHWPHGGGDHVVSVSAGYTYQKDSRVSLKVKDKTFTLFTQGAMAWTQDETEDDAVVKEIKSGETMIIKGTSSRGTRTTDTYSLKGSTDAYRAMMRACSEEHGKK